ncbi:hypothetical protein [Nocardia veterana]|uniref:Uncharacterized protein n=1 Tax=Nocardia veterana TaxID=132249 RepID=A0A7X6M0I0_9NOCA|nr:hypothetical protein [Nocardia veterana]NKY87556.1 hypothetical protein [Nocardia veterana]
MTIPQPIPDPGPTPVPASTVAPGSIRARGPNTAHAALLRRLRDISDGLRRMQETGRLGGQFGHFPAELWHDYLAEMHDRAEALTELGRAGGIPAQWLGYARGHSTAQVPDRWPENGAPPRAELIAAVAAQAREFGHIAALHAAYQLRATGESDRAQEAFADKMGQHWDRIGTVAALLQPVDAEREQIWPAATDPAWIATLADPVCTTDPGDLARRWRNQLSAPDADVSAHTALADYGDLTWDPDRELVPPPQSLINQISAALRAQRTVGGGAAIDANIGAALPEMTREFAPENTTGALRHGVVPALDPGPEP